MSVKRKAGEAIGDASAKQKSLSSFFGGSEHQANKSVKHDIKEAAIPPFDKQAWVNSLSESHKELLSLEIEGLHDSWLAVLKDELTKPYFIKLKEFLSRERKAHTVFPPEQDVYSWSRHTPLDTVRVVVLGQDPYHNVGQAHGLCFSVRQGTAIPPSLKNIYKAIKKDYPGFRIPQHGFLMPWADRGVLLLNACLTVRAHEANSHHDKGWEEFTSRVLKAVAARRTGGVVFLAWGTPASKRLAGLDLSKHHVLRSVHPSPLSASRGFFDCAHFIKTNEWLQSRYGPEGKIDWDSLLPKDTHTRATETKPDVGNKTEDSFEPTAEEEEALLLASETNGTDDSSYTTSATGEPQPKQPQKNET